MTATRHIPGEILFEKLTYYAKYKHLAKADDLAERVEAAYQRCERNIQPSCSSYCKRVMAYLIKRHPFVITVHVTQGPDSRIFIEIDKNPEEDKYT